MKGCTLSATTLMMSGEREDILLQVNHVRYKKNNGQLYLSQTRVGWMMDESDTFTVSVPYNDIRTQKISPEGKPKVQLQIVLHDISNFTFHFCTPEGRDKQIAERNQVKERLSQLMTQNRRQPPDELMEKKRMLDENEQLHHLYRALVPTSIISVDEFWKEIAGQYKQNMGPQQELGVSGAFLADIKPQTDGNNGKVQYNLTPEIMSAIFKTYPAVKKKHAEYVPHRMTEPEFWTLFFQSHYYSVHTTSSMENVFSECSKHDDKEWNRDVSSTQNDPLYALNDIYEEKPMSIESDLRTSGVKAGSNVFHALMIKRFNQHSLNIIKAQTNSEKERILDELAAKNPNGIPNGEAKQDIQVHKSKKARLEEKIVYEDLENSNKVETSSLTIHQRDRYLTGPTEYSAIHNLQPRQVTVLHEQLTDNINSWCPNLHISQDPEAAYRSLQHFSEMCRKGRSSVGVNTGDQLPGNLHKELGQVYSSAGELLRHFWSCFPPRTPQLQEKLHKMHETLCRYHNVTIRPFQEMAVNDYNCKSDILDHLTEMFQIASTKFENWKARNSRHECTMCKLEHAANLSCESIRKDQESASDQISENRPPPEFSEKSQVSTITVHADSWFFSSYNELHHLSVVKIPTENKLVFESYKLGNILPRVEFYETQLIPKPKVTIRPLKYLEHKNAFPCINISVYDINIIACENLR
nr:general transcription factor IIH subunit 1-like isoform X1 [Cherax quadricarinatus]